MSKPIISVRGIGKRYRLGAIHGGQSYKALRDTITDGLKAPFRMFFNNNSKALLRNNNSPKEFWALKDISFDVQQGEVIGIIGRNGAGKSTLLKILSQITEPTEGEIHLGGRMASLLEVGTGFHPELTGRENIFMNGAILGMTRSEIKKKFGEIVAFAEVEKFLDTPVKRYSSGMYVRLAFAVAAHLEPEILVVDEVLAVGDAAFQNKCLGKMHNIAAGGRTVLFVSHNMAAIRNLCGRVAFLRNGLIANVGKTQEMVAMYLAEGRDTPAIPLPQRTDREGNGLIRITGLTMNNSDGVAMANICSGDTVRFDIDYISIDRCRRTSFHIGFYDIFGVQIIHCSSLVTGFTFESLRCQGQISCIIQRLPLPPGRYMLNVAALQEGTLLDRVERAMEMNVVAGDYYGSGDTSSFNWAKCLVDHTWCKVNHNA